MPVLQVFINNCSARVGQGENDPYVSVHVDGEVQKTSTVQGGGAEPLWGEGVSEMRAMIVCICRGISVVHGFSEGGSGEVLYFYPHAVGVPHVTLKCWDADATMDVRPLLKDVIDVYVLMTW